MSVTATEAWGSQLFETGDRATAQRLFIVQGSDNPGDIEASLLVAAGTIFAGLILKSVGAKEQLGPLLWTGYANYESADNQKQTNDSTFTFDTTGGTFKVYQAKEQVSKYGVGGATPPDLMGAINVSEDKVEGVDITVPQYAFSETHYLPDSAVTNTYKGSLFALTGRTNAAPFKGCDTGEALFLGARGQKRGRGDWEITFSFAASPNASSLTVAGVPGIVKAGWDYLWVRYVQKIVGTGVNKFTSMIAQYIYVDRVYDSGDMSLLGIGTT